MRKNIFTTVKEYVTARSAAEFYGIHVNRRGMASCPFHDDHTPSLLLDQNFYCFGCQEKGDVIAFTSKLFNLRPIDTARKLIRDMGLPVSAETVSSPGSRDGPVNTAAASQVGTETQFADANTAATDTCHRSDAEKQLQELEDYYFSVLIRYRNRLQEQKSKYRPKHMDAEWDPRFMEALSNLSRTEYLLDLLLFGETGDKIAMMTDSQKEVFKLEKYNQSLHRKAGGRYPKPAPESAGEAGTDIVSTGIDTTGDNDIYDAAASGNTAVYDAGVAECTVAHDAGVAGDTGADTDSAAAKRPRPECGLHDGIIRHDISAADTRD